MAGFELPLMTMEHQYFVTETIPEIAEHGSRLPSLADRDGEYYLRPEGLGLLVGAYERDGRFWAEDGTPMDFGHELLPDDLDRIADYVERACARVPVLADAGIKRVINGPMILVRPTPPRCSARCPSSGTIFAATESFPGFPSPAGSACCSPSGSSRASRSSICFPGTWRATAIGRPRASPRRARWTATRTASRSTSPMRSGDAGRPTRMRPAYARQKALGAVFGLNYGWEHPLWFAGEGVEPKDAYGFERQSWFDAVAAECHALRDGVGIIDVSNFAKYEVVGPGAADWLDRVVANHVPKEVGRTCLTPLLGVRGGIAGDFTISKLGEDDFRMIGSGMAERYHARFFNMVEKPDGVTMRSLTDACAGFNVAGPKSRELLQRLTNEDLTNDGFRFMRARRMTVAGIDAVAVRVSFTGDLGSEVYVDEADQVALLDALLETGADLGVRPVGGRSLLSLRIEKGYGQLGPRIFARVLAAGGRPRPSDQARQARVSRPRRLFRDQGRDAALPARHAGCRRDHRRRLWRRADLFARWHAGRPGDLGRLWPYRRQVAGAGRHCERPYRGGRRIRCRHPRPAPPGAAAERSAVRPGGRSTARLSGASKQSLLE